MIRVRRGVSPPILVANARAWTRELLNLIARGATISSAIWNRYNSPQTKAAVVRDAFGKCIYCETKVLHNSFGDIEHLKPKKRFSELAYEWTNLGLVCTRCNNAKSDKYDEAMPPVDPFGEDPNVFFVPHGEWIWPRLANDRAQETISLVGLNRAELVLDRRKRLESIRTLAETLARTRGSHARSALADQLLEELANHSEYAFVTRSAALALDAVSQDDVERVAARA